MRLILFLFMFFQIGCATKYLIPGNRFMTPESQGGFLRGQFEIQKTAANQLTADLSNGSINDGVTYADIDRTGFLYSTSILEQFDLFWSHTGGANSLLGAKYQFLGASRAANGTGHKMAFSAAFGGNDYETEGSTSVEFQLGGKEFQVLYGFRFSELLMLYSNLSYATYNFTGTVKSTDASINGLEPKYETRVIALYGGLEMDIGIFMGKLECGYQQLQTTDTKDKTSLVVGYSVGVNW